MASAPKPIPIFDSFDNLDEPPPTTHAFSKDYDGAFQFLKAYKGSRATFNAYRREVERLLQWAWLIERRSVLTLDRELIERYIAFCQTPPKSWIGTKKVPRFVNRDGGRVANNSWRPFVVRLAKSAVKKGHSLSVDDYELSQSALKDLFAIVSSFYNFLIQENITEKNPILSIRQKSQYLRKRQALRKIRRLSTTEWEQVMQTAQRMAEEKPSHHERTLFIMSLLYCMYLRISELVVSERWAPQMNHFHQDGDECWWFTTVGKGNKERQISVSDEMLSALSRWRTHLNLSSHPSINENTPLLPKLKGRGGVTSTTYIREIVQLCFDNACIELKTKGLVVEADNLQEATVHWLRHTGISDDVKFRPKEHVRDDAGHSSSAITDRYIDIELKARHASKNNRHLDKESKD